MGGRQFWADELFFHQWRIQQNVLTGSCRLLDGNDFRHASGTYDECLAALEQIKRQRKLPPMRGRAVIVLHGLGADRSHMAELAKYLHDRGRYAVFNVTYPSTQRDIAANAKSLAHIIDNLDGIEEINFVAHSLGNIVVRRYLGDQTDAASGRRPDRRIKRFVMLAPPNHGSLLALSLGDNKVYQAITGQTGQQLGRDWQQLEGKLATPACEFGILAGGRGDGHGYNLLLPGDNDGIISVDTTRLAGAADFRVVPAQHSAHHVQRQGPGVHAAVPAEGLSSFPQARQRMRKAEGGGRKAEEADATPVEAPVPFRPALRPPPFSPAIDYGTVRIGVAISDPGRRIASPLENYTRRTPALDAQHFQRLAADEAIVLVGGRPAGPSRRPREPEVAGSPPLRPVARRGDGHAGRVLRRTLHQQRGRAVPAGRRIDRQTPQAAAATCWPPRSCSAPTSNRRARDKSPPAPWTR